MDPRVWDLHALLSALETTLDRSAKDDAERSRNRHRLYQPPAGVTTQASARPARTGMTRSQLQGLLALANTAGDG